MKNLFGLFILCCLGISGLTVRLANGQIEVRLEPDATVGSDTVWVDVRLVAKTDSLETAISSFQFRVVTDFGARFLGSETRYSLVEKEGWMSRHSLDNGRVGGFSSSLDAIETDGVLIRLQFLVLGTDTHGNLKLKEFRLNSGKPDHFPAVPSLSLHLIRHQE